MSTVLAVSDTTQTFQGLVNRTLEDFGREGEPKTESAIRRAVVRQLGNLKSERYNFTEATASVSLVADQGEYVRGSASFNLPLDLLYVNTVTIDYGTSSIDYILTRVTIEEMRHLRSSNVSTGRPAYYCWWAEQLFLHPVPSSANETITIDYHKDSTRDSSGNQLTINSSLETNEWFQFSAGEALLSAVVATEVCMRHLQDPDSATYFGTLAAAEREKLRNSYYQQSLNRGNTVPWL